MKAALFGAFVVITFVITNIVMFIGGYSIGLYVEAKGLADDEHDEDTSKLSSKQ